MKKILLILTSLAILQPSFAMDQSNDLWEYVIDKPGERRLSPAQQEEADRQLALQKVEREKELEGARKILASNPPNHYLRFLLSEAVHRGKSDCLQLLIDAGVDIHSLQLNALRNNTALMEAAYLDHADACKLLLKAGADMNKKNDDGETALQMAASGKRKLVCQVLIGHQREVNSTYIALLYFYRMKYEKKPIGVLYQERQHLLLPYLVQGKYVPMAKLLSIRGQFNRTLYEACPIDCLKPEPEGWFTNCSIQ